jgi:hypothetical protein
MVPSLVVVFMGILSIDYRTMAARYSRCNPAAKRGVKNQPMFFNMLKPAVRA